MEINKLVYSYKLLSDELKNNIYNTVISLIHETNKNDIHNNSYDLKTIQQIMLDNGVFIILQLIKDRNENDLGSYYIKIQGYSIIIHRKNNDCITTIITRLYNDVKIFEKQFENDVLISEYYNDIKYDDSYLFMESNISNQIEIDEKDDHILNSLKRKLNIENNQNKKSNYKP